MSLNKRLISKIMTTDAYRASQDVQNIIIHYVYFSAHLQAMRIASFLMHKIYPLSNYQH